MSLLTYNGIKLPFSHTTNFSQEVVYDDMGGTDRMYHRFNISVQAVLNTNYMHMIADDFAAFSGTGENAAVIMARLRQTLMTPRRRLTFSFNGTNLLPGLTAGQGTVDSANGPKPQMCNIVQLTNTTFIIQYTITASYVENNATTANNLLVANRTGHPVVMNKWTESVDIDDCMFTTRTRTGKYVIRSDNPDGKIADFYRSQMAVVSVPNGFLRVSSKYTVSPDGLAIDYNVVDKEAFKMPPRPAFRAEGKYRESTTYGGVIRYGDCNVTLWGCKDKNISPQNALAQVAYIIAGSKLAIMNPLGDAIIQGGFIEADMYQNVVSVHVRAMLTTGKKVVSPGQAVQGARLNREIPFPSFWEHLVYTPRSEDGTPSPPYVDRGTAGLLLQAAKYYDPALQGTELGTGDVWDPAEAPKRNNLVNLARTQLTEGLRVGEAGVRREV